MSLPGAIAASISFMKGAVHRLYDADESAYAGVKSPTAITTSVDYTLPAAPPTADGQTLTATTVGAMSWASAGLVNSSMETVGVGTNYTLTGSSARVDFGTTDPEVVLNENGIWIITAIVAVSVGSANSTFTFYLYDVSAAQSITTRKQWWNGGGDEFQVVLRARYNCSGQPKTIQLYGQHDGGASGATVISTRTSIDAMRLL